MESLLKQKKADLQKRIKREMENKNKLAELELNEIKDKCIKTENELSEMVSRDKISKGGQFRGNK